MKLNRNNLRLLLAIVLAIGIVTDSAIHFFTGSTVSNPPAMASKVAAK